MEKFFPVLLLHLSAERRISRNEKERKERETENKLKVDEEESGDQRRRWAST